MTTYMEIRQHGTTVVYINQKEYKNYADKLYNIGHRWYLINQYSIMNPRLKVPKKSIIIEKFLESFIL